MRRGSNEGARPSRSNSILSVKRPSIGSTSFFTRAAQARLLGERDDPEYELYQNIWKTARLLPPATSRVHGRNVRKWSYFLFLIASYEMIYIPLQFAFQEPRLADGSFCLPAGQLALQYLIDACFFVDIVVHMHTMYISGADEGNELVTDARRIRRRYLRTTFAFDVLAALPLDLLFGGGGLNGVCGAAAQGLRLNRVLHVFRLFTIHGGQLAQLGRLTRYAPCPTCGCLPACDPHTHLRDEHPQPPLPIPPLSLSLSLA